MPAGQSLGTADAAAVRTEVRQRETNNERMNEITACRGWLSTQQQGNRIGEFLSFTHGSNSAAWKWADIISFTLPRGTEVKLITFRRQTSLGIETNMSPLSKHKPGEELGEEYGPFRHSAQTLARWSPHSQNPPSVFQIFYDMKFSVFQILCDMMDLVLILTAVSPHRADIPSHTICWFRESCSTATVKPSSTLPTGDRQTWKTETITALRALRPREKSRKNNHSQLPSGQSLQGNTCAPSYANPGRHRSCKHHCSSMKLST